MTIRLVEVLGQYKKLLKFLGSGTKWEICFQLEPSWFAFQFLYDKRFNALGKLLSIVLVTLIFFGIYPLGLFHSNLNHLVVSRWNDIKIIIAINGTIELVWVSGEKCKAGW